MSYTALEIVNKALAKIGGAGDQFGGKPFVISLSATDKISSFCNTLYPQIRTQVIIDFALQKCPFKETVKYADLGQEFTQYDEIISDISVGAGPGFAVTITTKVAHEYTTGDTLSLLKVRGTGGIETLNNTAYDITVVDTTSFTLDDTVGDADWVYTEDSGISSYLPEIGGWQYAFDLPDDCIAVAEQLHEAFVSTTTERRSYRFGTMLNSANDGKILVTNDISNIAEDSAFIQYVIDQDETTLFSDALVQCIASLLAAELCPICGKDLKTRQSLLMEYDTIIVPAAKAFNQSQLNNYAKAPVSYLGGRGAVSQIRYTTIR